MTALFHDFYFTVDSRQVKGGSTWGRSSSSANDLQNGCHSPAWLQTHITIVSVTAYSSLRWLGCNFESESNLVGFDVGIAKKVHCMTSREWLSLRSAHSYLEVCDSQAAGGCPESNGHHSLATAEGIAAIQESIENEPRPVEMVVGSQFTMVSLIFLDVR